MNSIKTTYILQKGLYNCNNFMTYLLSILPSSFSISINTITNKYKFTNATYEFIISGNCTQILGFSLSSSASSSSRILTMPYMCNFNGLQSFNIHLTNIITKNIDSFNKSPSNIIQSIPIDENSSSISYIKNDDFNFVINQEIIDDLTIELRDDQDNLINFNNQNWNLTLYFSIIKDIDRFSRLNTFQNIFNKSPSNIIQSIPIDVNSSSISYIKNADFNFVINQEIIDDLTKIELR